MLEKLAFSSKCHIYHEGSYNEGFRLPKDYNKCLFNNTSNNIDVLLIGDSHAAHYATAVIIGVKNVIFLYSQ